MADTCYITCPKTGLKVILEYLEEGWLGRTQNKVQGVIFKYDPSNDTTTKIKDVAEKDVTARIEGCWQDKVYYTLGSKPFNKVAVCRSRTYTIEHEANNVLGKEPYHRPQSARPNTQSGPATRAAAPQ